MSGSAKTSEVEEAKRESLFFFLLSLLHSSTTMQSTSTTVSSQQQQRSLPSTTPQPRLTLSPYISPSTGYKFPSIYSFPPFFTKQPNLTTWQHQQQQWIQLILSHSRHTRCSRLELSNESLRAMELFTNREINRTTTFSLSLVDHLSTDHMN